MKYDQLLKKFRDGATDGRAGVGYGGRNGMHGGDSHVGARLYIQGNVVFSYGSHFPLAIRGEFGGEVRFIINGDASTLTTNSQVREAIGILSGNVQIPFSALQGAGLLDRHDPGSLAITIVEATADETWYECVQCKRKVVQDEEDYTYSHEADKTPICPEVVRAGARSRQVRYQHRLGEVLFKHEGNYYLSGRDHQELSRRDNYFLCQIPGAPKSVEEAYAGLKPAIVAHAETIGSKVLRQGDIYLIENEQPFPKGTKREKLKDFQLFDTRHVASTAFKYGQNGTSQVFITGKLAHTARQHASLFLKGKLYSAVKNLALGSWNAIGNID